jgi:hypothetical protein
MYTQEAIDLQNYLDKKISNSERMQILQNLPYDWPEARDQFVLYWLDQKERSFKKTSYKDKKGVLTSIKLWSEIEPEPAQKKTRKDKIAEFCDQLSEYHARLTFTDDMKQPERKAIKFELDYDEIKLLDDVFRDHTVEELMQAAKRRSRDAEINIYAVVKELR